MPLRGLKTAYHQFRYIRKERPKFALSAWRSSAAFAHTRRKSKRPSTNCFNYTVTKIGAPRRQSLLRISTRGGVYPAAFGKAATSYFLPPKAAIRQPKIWRTF